MTKNDFREELLNCGFTYLHVVSYPNGNGGRDIGVCVDEPELGCRDRIEWSGDLTDALHDRRLVFATWDVPLDAIQITLEELIVASLSM